MWMVKFSCGNTNLERIPSQDVIDLDITYNQDEESRFVSINNGVTVIRFFNQGRSESKTSFKYNSFVPLLTLFYRRILPRVRIDLDGTLGEQSLYPFSHYLSNRVRDVLHQLPIATINAPPMLNPLHQSCSSYLSSLPLISLSSTEECSICETEYAPNDDIVKLPCGHAFHLACISTWGEKHNSCPLCRSVIQPPGHIPARPAIEADPRLEAQIELRSEELERQIDDRISELEREVETLTDALDELIQRRDDDLASLEDEKGRLLDFLENRRDFLEERVSCVEQERDQQIEGLWDEKNWLQESLLLQQDNLLLDMDNKRMLFEMEVDRRWENDEMARNEALNQFNAKQQARLDEFNSMMEKRLKAFDAKIEEVKESFDSQIKTQRRVFESERRYWIILRSKSKRWRVGRDRLKRRFERNKWRS
ncbi:uncharacterized protein [Blastocystis hominis]|uniref:RING-type domain-containing protein n=1 Tax=Blastocystis hominis TaxID=12968 RepID=D8M6P8_BLAHO|nr:uncharacterized protein [Blastocystis hominis]CBK23466.2 unnamed protein product [Blastocystis hominis]|eukprot:XP_012897514.1 uncharacterized protein [Blastocystis hominis]